MRMLLPLSMLLAAPAMAGAADPTAFASHAEVQAQVAAMDKAMTPGQGFAWQPVMQSDGHVAALEIWRSPGRPAVHPAETEYVIVVDGGGTMVSGGTLVDPKVVQHGLTEGSRIAGGTSRTLAPGDVFLIPAGVPHWFGITGDRLVMLGTKLPAPR